jgi:Tol biopolymer transport system component
MPLRSGQTLQNRYQILHPLGQGGMGAVYLAQDGRLSNKLVAIKEFNPTILPPQDRAWATQSFEREAQILAQLNHPALTAVSDYFTEHGMVYLVMEYVPGETLHQCWLNQPQRRFDSEQVLNWASQLCSVLTYLHSQNPPIIFRDLKPTNIMVQPDGQLKLIDFGIARYFKPGQTQDTVPLGTIGYAAPEQFGVGQADVRSDVYSLGIILHQLLTGDDPVQNPVQLFPQAQKIASLPAPFATAVAQALQQDPNQRPQTAQEFHTLLFAAVPQTPPPKVWGAMVAAFLFIILAGLFFREPLSAWSIVGQESTATNTPAVPVAEVTVIVTVPVIYTLTPTAVPENTPVSTATATAESTPTPTDTPTPMQRDIGTIEDRGTMPSGRLTFVSDRGGRDAIYVMDVANPGDIRQITNPNGRDWWPTWCGPEALVFERADRAINPNWQEIYVVAAGDPDQIRPITTSQFPSGSDENGSPSCSPDGRYLAFSTHPIGGRGNDFRIGLVDLWQPSARFTLIGDGYSLAGSVTWAPDGQTIAFMHSRSAGFQIYRLALAAPFNPQNLTENYPGSSKYPTWSPDGTHIAFACTYEPFESGVWGLCMTPSDRSDVRVLLRDIHNGGEWDRTTDQAFHAITPSWSPDGRWLAYAANWNGSMDIYLYEVDTGRVINLTNNRFSKDMHPRWAP